MTPEESERTLALERERDELASRVHALEEGLLSWLMGQRNVSAYIKRAAGLKGEIDHFMASAFFRGLLAMLYVGWNKRYIFFHDKRHPRDMGKVAVEAFLGVLAVERSVSAATQTQALALSVDPRRSVGPAGCDG